MSLPHVLLAPQQARGLVCSGAPFPGMQRPSLSAITPPQLHLVRLHVSLTIDLSLPSVLLPLDFVLLVLQAFSWASPCSLVHCAVWTPTRQLLFMHWNSPHGDSHHSYFTKARDLGVLPIPPVVSLVTHS